MLLPHDKANNQQKSKSPPAPMPEQSALCLRATLPYMSIPAPSGQPSRRIRALIL